MALQLSTITCNHDPAAPATSTLNNRKNKDFEVPIPEYDSSIPRTPPQSCAAYAKHETSGQTVVIRAHFQIPAAVNITYEVKASGGGMLGHLDAVQVVFSGGIADQVVDIPLPHRNFQKIQRADITWLSRYRKQGASNRHPLAPTPHPIYLILPLPPPPCTQVFADK